MTGGFTLGRILGFPVFVGWSAVFVLALLVMMGRSDDPAELFAGLLYGLALFGSVLVHELGHAVAGRRMGLQPVGILLHGFGGLCQYGRPPTAPQGVVAALAGPAAGIALGLFALLLEMSAPAVLPPMVLGLLGQLVVINLFWSLFNLLPMFPLDGGSAMLHVLRMLVSESLAAKLTRAISVLCALAAGVLAYLAGFSFLLIIVAFVLLQNLRG